MKSKTSLKAEKLLKSMKLEECVKISNYDDVEIDMCGILDLFEKPFFEFIELSSFLRNMEAIKICGEINGKIPNIFWNFKIKENFYFPVSLIFEIAKKYKIDSIILSKDTKSIKKDFINLFSNLNYKKLLDFVQNTSEENLRNGVFLRFVHKTGI